MTVEISEGCSRRNTRDLERVGTGRQQPFDAPGAAIREREGAAPVEIGIVREVGSGRCWNGRIFTEGAIVS
jgi:hypothetical protein